MIELKSWMKYLARDKDGQLNGYNSSAIFKDPEFGAWMSVRPGAGGVMGEPIDDDADLFAIEVHWDNTYPTRIVRNGEKVVLREIVKEEYNYALRQASPPPPKPLFTHEWPRKHNTDVFDAVRHGFEWLAKVDNGLPHTPHYMNGHIETIDVIKMALTPEEFRGFLKGNVLKYQIRAPHKHETPDEDYQKAKDYYDLLEGLE